jgi:hypothetical protein
LDALSSHERIRRLESDASLRHQLVHVLAELEKKMDDKIVDVVELENSTSKSANHKAVEQHSTPRLILEKSAAEQFFTEPQKDIVKLLNALPNLKKEIAFIDIPPSAHAALICRDMGKYKFSDAGKGILQHWADNFII